MKKTLFLMALISGFSWNQAAYSAPEDEQNVSNALEAMHNPNRVMPEEEHNERGNFQGEAESESDTGEHNLTHEPFDSEVGNDFTSPVSGGTPSFVLTDQDFELLANASKKGSEEQNKQENDPLSIFDKEIEERRAVLGSANQFPASETLAPEMDLMNFESSFMNHIDSEVRETVKELENNPDIQDLDQQIANLVDQKNNSLLSRLWANKYVRLSIYGGALLGASALGYYVLPQDIQQAIKEGVTNLPQNAQVQLISAWDSLRGFSTSALNTLQNAGRSAYNAAGNVFSAAGNYLGELKATAGDYLSDLKNRAGDIAMDFPRAARETLGNAYTSTTTYLGGLKGAAGDRLNELGEYGSSLKERASNAVGDAYTSTTTYLGDRLNELGEYGSSLKESASNAYKNAATHLENLKDTAGTQLNQFGTTMSEYSAALGESAKKNAGVAKEFGSRAGHFVKEKAVEAGKGLWNLVKGPVVVNSAKKLWSWWKGSEENKPKQIDQSKTQDLL